MAARTYQPTLRLLAHTMSVFIGRYSALILAHMTGDQVIIFNAYVAALNELIEALGTGSGS